MSEIQVWRLCAAEHAGTAFSGEGAKQFGGRWSFAGAPVVYCSATRSLCTLEILAHLDEPARLAMRRWVHIAATLPSACVLHPPRVPDTWRKFPHSAETQRFGTIWTQERRSVALCVPSAIVPGEFNYLLNPLHPDFAKVKVAEPEPYEFDPRLVQRSQQN